MDWFLNIVLPNPRAPQYVADKTRWWFRAGMNVGCLIGAVATSLLWWWWF